MPADLVGGGYQLYNPIWSASLGRFANVTQSNVPARSNVELFGPRTEALGTITSEKGLFAAIPVTWGDIISNVRVGVITTEGESSEETIAAIYSGVAVTKETTVIAQSAVVKEQLKKEKGYSLALKESVLITPTNAPSGYVYAGIFNKETTATVKLAGWKVANTLQYTSTTVKQALGAYYCLEEASTGSFASAKSGFEVIGSKVSTEVPYIILT